MVLQTLVYKHLFLDHRLLACPICDSLVRLTNYQKHLLKIHDTDWSDTTFISAFIEKFPIDFSTFELLSILNYTFPEAIVHELIKSYHYFSTIEPEFSVLLGIKSLVTRRNLLKNVSTIGSTYQEIYQKAKELNNPQIMVTVLVNAIANTNNVQAHERIEKELFSLVDNSTDPLDPEHHLSILLQYIEKYRREKNLEKEQQTWNQVNSFFKDQKLIGTGLRSIQFEIEEKRSLDQPFKNVAMKYYHATKDDFPNLAGVAKLYIAYADIKKEDFKSAQRNLIASGMYFKNNQNYFMYLRTSDALATMFIKQGKYFEAFQKLLELKDIIEETEFQARLTIHVNALEIIKNNFDNIKPINFDKTDIAPFHKF